MNDRKTSTRLFMIIGIILIVAAYILSDKTLPFLPFVFVVPLLYFFKKYVGFIMAYSWFGFLTLVYYYSSEDITLGIKRIISGALIFTAFLIYISILKHLRDFVIENYPPGALRDERQKALFVNLALGTGIIITGTVTVKVNYNFAHNLGMYILIVILVFSLFFQIIMRIFQHSPKFTSANAINLSLSLFGWGITFLPIAYMMTVYTPSAAYIYIVLLTYCAFLTSFGGSILLLQLQIIMRRILVPETHVTKHT